MVHPGERAHHLKPLRKVITAHWHLFIVRRSVLESLVHPLLMMIDRLLVLAHRILIYHLLTFPGPYYRLNNPFC